MIVLHHMHNLGFIHRCVSPRAVMFKNDGSARVGSFQSACAQGTRESPLEMEGILEYAAPEVLLCGGFNDSSDLSQQNAAPLQYSYPVDVWALGITTYTCLVGRIPFASDNNELLFHRILFTEPEYPGDMDPKARSFIAQCLRKRPSDRPAIDDLLSDPFILDNLNWKGNNTAGPDHMHCCREITEGTISQVRPEPVPECRSARGCGAAKPVPYRAGTLIQYMGPIIIMIITN
jgi:serine/threonine protein kinase